MPTSWSLFSGFNKLSKVPSGRAPNASLVGAKTVNGPGELSVSTKSPATTAATKVERSSTDCASSTMLGLASLSAGGRRTPSMMCATPFEARLSAPTTLAVLAYTSPLVTVTRRSLPSTVVTTCSGCRSVDNTWAGSTWYVRMSTSEALFSGFNKLSKVPSGRAPKASLVGANTVNGPGELRVSTRSPATTAATRVERSSTDCASSTMLGLSLDKPAGGRSTPSMMCATPLEARLSAPVTFFRSWMLGPTFTSPWYLMTCTGLPSTVFTAWKVFRSVDKTWTGSTWYVRMSTSVALFSGFKRSSNVPAGSA